MTTRTFTRAAFIATLASAGALAVATPASAARDAEAERYVQESAQEVLRSLSTDANSSTQRQQSFTRLMTEFADMPRVAGFVLGRYSAQLRADPALRSEWTRAFQDYAIAVYEVQLNQYSSSTLRVTNSIERVPGSDVIVISEMTPRGAARPTRVQWRLLRSNNGPWKVVDVALLIDGREIWLAQQQQQDFLARLDRNNGDIRALMTAVRGQTASMRQRLVART